MKRTTDEQDEEMLAVEKIMAGMRKLRWLLLIGDLFAFMAGTAFGFWLAKW